MSFCFVLKVVVDVCSIQNLIGVVYVLVVVGWGLNLKVSGVDGVGEGNNNDSNWWRLVGGGCGEGGQGRRSMQQRP